MKREVRMSDMERVNELALGTLVGSTASKWTMGGTLATTYGWLTSSGAAVLIGILVTVLGFIINYLYQRRRDAREIQQIAFRQQMEQHDEERKQAEEARRIEFHLAQMAALKSGLQTKI